MCARQYLSPDTILELNAPAIFIDSGRTCECRSPTSPPTELASPGSRIGQTVRWAPECRCNGRTDRRAWSCLPGLALLHWGFVGMQHQRGQSFLAHGTFQACSATWVSPTHSPMISAKSGAMVAKRNTCDRVTTNWSGSPNWSHRWSNSKRTGRMPSSSRVLCSPAGDSCGGNRAANLGSRQPGAIP